MGFRDEIDTRVKLKNRGLFDDYERESVSVDGWWWFTSNYVMFGWLFIKGMRTLV